MCVKGSRGGAVTSMLGWRSGGHGFEFPSSWRGQIDLHFNPFTTAHQYLSHFQQQQLDKSQRPKGLCSIPSQADDRGAALLILVGQRSAEESGLMAPSLESEFKLSLKYIMLKAGKLGCWGWVQ